MTLLETARIGDRGRIYVPPAVLAHLGLKKGDTVVFRDGPGRVVIEKLR